MKVHSPRKKYGWRLLSRHDRREFYQCPVQRKARKRGIPGNIEEKDPAGMWIYQLFRKVYMRGPVTKPEAPQVADPAGTQSVPQDSAGTA